jgi:hypothetical protein
LTASAALETFLFGGWKQWLRNTASMHKKLNQRAGSPGHLNLRRQQLRNLEKIFGQRPALRLAKRLFRKKKNPPTVKLKLGSCATIQ